MLRKTPKIANLQNNSVYNYNTEFLLRIEFISFKAKSNGKFPTLYEFAKLLAKSCITESLDEIRIKIKEIHSYIALKKFRESNILLKKMIKNLFDEIFFW